MDIASRIFHAVVGSKQERERVIEVASESGRLSGRDEAVEPRRLTPDLLRRAGGCIGKRDCEL